MSSVSIVNAALLDHTLVLIKNLEENDMQSCLLVCLYLCLLFKCLHCFN